MTIGRFLLLSFDYIRPKDPNISLASSSIMALLQSKLQSGNQSIMELHHRQYNVKNTQFDKLMMNALGDVQEIKPDVIATGVYVWNEAFVTPLFEHLHRTPYRPKYIIYGGPQITYSAKGTLETSYPSTDFFIRGYGEESLLQLLKNIHEAGSAAKISNIDGVHVKSQPDRGVKSQYQLSALPSPLLIPGLVDHRGFIRWETKRGCPFECAFCQHKDSYKNRLQCNPERIYKEQEWIAKNNIRDISVVDPIYNSGGSEYLKNLSGFLKHGYKGRLNMQARFEMINSAFLNICSKLQENGALVQLEFGIQTIMKKESVIIKRMNNLKKVVTASEELHARNIPFEVSLIYGLPEQTLESFQASLEWVKTFIKPNAIKAWPLMLLKGTPLYDQRNVFKMREKILDENLEELDKSRQYNGIPHVVESSSFTETAWNEMKSLAISINRAESQYEFTPRATII